ncbi:TPA: YceH family protein [Vibrio parahaemolyticus]|uniref:YceH family protein n=1 Tax=Vibrio parahaemolyticus TaxID=670 RepID=UPI00146CEAA9|nr:YceH family protein [Vibrio parahaemolyticus]MDF4695776.1 YceH family protein [Vibrio parahaemolyticus]MDF4723879.1 YceH family protein [Vibrio parahaemolyticus]MDF5023374.1 YceH family protein [Vibrio parahaemolyticus]MDF5042444.1 YceH family protein [Vibrio parahaemolyticus]MDF5047571.1 YceH family protein [Vibrio parahaemolyticus]
MKVELTAIEARVIGCLIEKEVTTPDQYPLSLNALTNACNQKSNREPVMALSESDVLDAVDALIERRLVSDESAFNSRVSKYQHRFCNTEFGDLKLSDQEKGIICCMLLRGAQTPGEIRTRTNRLATFHDVKEVEAVLEHLASEEKGPFVVKLPREAGKRESRYMHLFCGEVDVSAMAAAVPATSSSSERVAQLEQEVAELREELDALKAQVESLLS